MINSPTYSRRVIEIADYIFAHPMQNREDFIAHFSTKLHKGRRTINTYISQAKEYNKSRSHRIEKEKEKVIINSEKEAFKSAILTREQSLEILSKIAMGAARKIEGKILCPSDAERTRAISTIAEFQGWNAPVKSDVNIKRPIFNIEVSNHDTKVMIDKLLDTDA